MPNELNDYVNRLDVLLSLARSTLKDLRRAMQDPKVLKQELSSKEKLLHSKIDQLLTGLVELEQMKADGRCD